MNVDLQTPSFSLHGEFNGKPISPDNVDLLTLIRFGSEVSDLLQGDLERADLGKPKVTLSPGSLKLSIVVPMIVATSFASDLKIFSETWDLDGIASKRAKVLEKWRAKSSATQHYSLAYNNEGLTINSETLFRHRQKDLWGHTEKYLRGKVVDLGGKTNPNIHLVLSNNESLKIQALEEQLRGADYLYEEVTLEVRGREHLETGKLDELYLLQVHRPAKVVDEDQL